jgi:hypothetical protein
MLDQDFNENTRRAEHIAGNQTRNCACLFVQVRDSNATSNGVCTRFRPAFDLVDQSEQARYPLDTVGI